MRDVVDIIAGLRERAEEGSKSNRRLAALIIGDIGYAAQAPIAELAKRAHVSEPTVTRLARSVGCDGTRDFKLKLAQALAIGALYLKPTPPERGEREEHILNLISSSAIKSIERLQSSLDMGAVAQLSEQIIKSPRILIIGSGGISSMMAVELQNRLFRFRLNTIAHVDGQMQRMQSAMSDATTLLIAFSASGNSRSVIDSTLVARQYGAATAAITTPASPLASAAQLVIPYQTAEDGNIYKPTSLRYALLVIVDVIATTVAESLGPDIIEGMRRIKQSLGTTKPGEPSMPLGD